jgi:uncharacterized membrane protein YgdD (TMEM256/DUF423 family)
MFSWQSNKLYTLIISFKNKFGFIFPTGMGVLMLIGCPMKDFAGLRTTPSG